VKGIIKWFNNAKGYGFITPDGGGNDVFAHFSAINMEGYKTIKQGQKVQFELIDGPRGLQATKITPAFEAYNSGPPIEIVISPGNATAGEIAELFNEFSILYNMVGGSNLEFTNCDSRRAELVIEYA